MAYPGQYGQAPTQPPPYGQPAPGGYPQQQQQPGQEPNPYSQVPPYGAPPNPYAPMGGPSVPGNVGIVSSKVKLVLSIDGVDREIQAFVQNMTGRLSFDPNSHSFTISNLSGVCHFEGTEAPFNLTNVKGSYEQRDGVPSQNFLNARNEFLSPVDSKSFQGGAPQGYPNPNQQQMGMPGYPNMNTQGFQGQPPNQPGYPNVGQQPNQPQPGYPNSQPGYPNAQPQYQGQPPMQPQPGYPQPQPGYPQPQQPMYPGQY
ncbi:hypothetical protein TRFO_12301 [Tritrichomonas foetus]|uniref:Uncharacterized protein n=1 Tax=Tritrichomonas foetus TaxID=1144522 RepID=A0A1J4IZH4_9EUKA|nr:hypothetical protein TRFO_12301 [Tritrichomonas foetus]|eukprot:OHS92752.1 hypothetical protein TRFO_12301 [Tritrichomonas foetus]